MVLEHLYEVYERNQNALLVLPNIINVRKEPSMENIEEHLDVNY